MKLHSISRAPAALAAPAQARSAILTETSVPRQPFRPQRIANHARGTAPIRASSSGDASPPANVEDRRAGRSTYRPDSYTELIGDAVQAIAVGMADGLTRMEVEFPALSNVDGERERRGRGWGSALSEQMINLHPKRYFIFVPESKPPLLLQATRARPTST